MSKIVGDIAVEVSADIGPLQRGLRNARGDVSRFGRTTEQMARRATRATVAMTGAFVAATAAGVALANHVGQLGERLTNLSNVAGTTPEKFQEMAIATRSVGVEQEKLADILKDVQDRVGDFLATGGGPMADFFENIAPKVGVTAEQFARLSGPEALQLYVSSLERANITQSEMTFYLEAMSSDLTTMLPLLRDNGREMERLGREARETGAIISNEAVEGAAELQEKLRGMRNEIDANLIDALVDLEDELEALLDFVNEYGIPAFKKIVEWAASAAEGVGVLTSAIRVMQGLDATTPADSNSQFPVPEGEEFPPGTPSTTGTHPIDDFILEGLNGQGRANSPSMVRPRGRPSDLDTGGGSRGVGGGRAGPTEDDLDRLRDQFATEQEIIQENYEKQLEQLQEFRDRKLTTEEEFNELERRIQKEHQEKMLDLEYKHRAERLQAVLGGGQAILQEMGAFNDKALKLSQVFGAGQALVSTYIGAAKELEKGALGFATAAAVIAKGIGFVAAINGVSASSGGGAAAAGGGGVGGTGTPSAPQNNQYVHVNLSGEGPIGRGSVRGLIDQINEAIDDGAVLRGITVSG